MSIPLGEIAALGTALCWTASSLAFAAAGRRMGSLSLNLVRLVLAFVFLGLYNFARRGLPLPLDASAEAWGWLFVSGLVGFVFGDMCLFRAFLLIGPRVAMLVMSLAPPMAAVLGWLVLGERISSLGIAGMIVTLVGVAIVVRERTDLTNTAGTGPKGESGKGVLLALGGATGQAVGLVLSKIGMKTYDPFAATQIRIIAGIVGFSFLFTFIQWWGRAAVAVRDRTALGFAALGAIAGPFVGVSLSLLSIQHTETGVAATIMATTPVLLIPAVILVHKEYVSLRAILGALVAVSGVALLCIR
ncbi:DMT family transporter [Polyangium jinanense]|uniref:DMT family transporter n=1 Tax=Polyangium jinanense TaxID=2829994 RepID=A0A9X3X3U0_9BACT|nr:DMT family transporter [Polyangium jinanense]MDC3954633.1 DMT family transporter [Polyangium jinanense]MDC3980936.1 DMT family transporter [Polyangium jinanense]